MNTTFAQYNYHPDEISLGFVKEGQVLPLVITAQQSGLDVNVWAAANKDLVKSLITVYGGLLFRDFSGSLGDGFEQFIATVTSPVLKYTEQSSPRHAVGGNIYTSTDHPQDEEIFLHSEHSYNLNFPNWIVFNCQVAAPEGGTTPIADVRKIYQHLDPQIRDRFLQKQYRYSRCFWPMMGMTWQKAFQSDSQSEVEQYCRDNQIHFEWVDDALKTYQIRPPVAIHPVSGEKCWFNHCTFFNITTLDEDTREMLTCSFADDELPNNTYYGDGTAIAPDVMDSLRAAYEAQKVTFNWQKGDILMLDNIMIAHGRGTFGGERKILVGMSEPVGWANVACKG
jgi:alpha-ketoglutarate-dependent taurine dioxygenase